MLPYIGYQYLDDYLITLEIPENSKTDLERDVIRHERSLFRTNKVHVQKITHIITQEEHKSVGRFRVSCFVKSDIQSGDTEYKSGIWFTNKEYALKLYHISQPDYTGDVKQYTRDGLLKASGSLVHGRKSGPWTYYHESETCHFTYLNDKRNGLSTIYYINGRCKEQIPYLQDNKHGTEKWFHPNGKIWKISTFVHGRHIGYTRWYDKRGNMTLKVYHSSNDYQSINSDL